MEAIIRDALLNVGLETLPEKATDDLSSYGLDSLTCALLFSELETATKRQLSTKDFTEESFRTIENIESFIKGNTK